MSLWGENSKWTTLPLNNNLFWTLVLKVKAYCSVDIEMEKTESLHGAFYDFCEREKVFNNPAIKAGNIFLASTIGK